MTRAVASPSVRALAARNGIDLDGLSRALGRETLERADVERAMRGTTGGPSEFWDVDHAAYGPVTEEPVPRIRRVAARNLSAAHTLIPAVTHHDEAEVDAVEAFRADIRSESEARGTKMSALAFHVATLARTLRSHPRFNSSLTPDGRTLILKGFVHVGIAVDTEHGLAVPVIRNADEKGLFAIADEIVAHAARARERRLRPEDAGGASMTITNLGGLGGTAFTPIVNPPEVAILGISRTKVQPVWDGERFCPKRMVPLDLSYDHRVADGADAARFLTHYAGLLAEPRRLLL